MFVSVSGGPTIEVGGCVKVQNIVLQSNLEVKFEHVLYSNIEM
jgi:hypothetical protein